MGEGSPRSPIVALAGSGRAGTSQSPYPVPSIYSIPGRIWVRSLNVQSRLIGLEPRIWSDYPVDPRSQLGTPPRSPSRSFQAASDSVLVRTDPGKRREPGIGTPSRRSHLFLPAPGPVPGRPCGPLPPSGDRRTHHGLSRTSGSRPVVGATTCALAWRRPRNGSWRGRFWSRGGRRTRPTSSAAPTGTSACSSSNRVRIAIEARGARLA